MGGFPTNVNSPPAFAPPGVPSSRCQLRIFGDEHPKIHEELCANELQQAATSDSLVESRLAIEEVTRVAPDAVGTLAALHALRSMPSATIPEQATRSFGGFPALSAFPLKGWCWVSLLTVFFGAILGDCKCQMLRQTRVRIFLSIRDGNTLGGHPFSALGRIATKNWE